ncbi:MAG: hypothetical protein LBB18_02070 [Puniceicoccales bacterium]|jgi:hypothetical protein|nr:hypothetical protein [Puniceicoccales bacterium]
MKTTITVRLIQESEDVRTIDFVLGNFALSAHENARYLCENLRDGKCDMGMPVDDKVCAKFCKYGLNRITKKDNPEIFGILYKVFVEDKEQGFVEVKLDQRDVWEQEQPCKVKEKKLKITKDKNTMALLSDADFISYGKNLKSVR